MTECTWFMVCDYPVEGCWRVITDGQVILESGRADSPDGAKRACLTAARKYFDFDLDARLAELEKG